MAIDRTRVRGRAGSKRKPESQVPDELALPVSDVGIVEQAPVVSQAVDVSESIDLFLEGRGERLRHAEAELPHMTLVIGDRALRAVKVGDKWLMETMARRAFMFSKVHNMPWVKRNNPDELGVQFKLRDIAFVAPFGLLGVAGKSGGGKTVLMTTLLAQHVDAGKPGAYVNVGEPVPEADNDIANILTEIAIAIINDKRGAVLMFDSFKGPLFKTPGSAGKGGFTRPFFQDLSDLSSIMARYQIIGVGAINFQSEDQAVAKEVTEALVGNTVGVFEVLSSNPQSVNYRFYKRNYISGERAIDNVSLDKPEFTVVNGSAPTATVDQVVNALQKAMYEAPVLAEGAVTARRITRSLFNK